MNDDILYLGNFVLSHSVNTAKDALSLTISRTPGYISILSLFQSCIGLRMAKMLLLIYFGRVMTGEWPQVGKS